MSGFWQDLIRLRDYNHCTSRKYPQWTSLLSGSAILRQLGVWIGRVQRDRLDLIISLSRKRVSGNDMLGANVGGMWGIFLSMSENEYLPSACRGNDSPVNEVVLKEGNWECFTIDANIVVWSSWSSLNSVLWSSWLVVSVSWSAVSVFSVIGVAGMK